MGGAVAFAMQGQGADECSVVVLGPVNGAVRCTSRMKMRWVQGREGVWGNERTPGGLAMENDLGVADQHSNRIMAVEVREKGEANIDTYHEAID